MTPLRLILWAVLSMSSAVLVQFLPWSDESIARLLAPLAAMLTVAAITGVWLHKATRRQVKWSGIGIAVGAFAGVMVGSRWSPDAQGALMTLITLPAGMLVGATAGLFVPRKPDADRD